MNRLMAWLRNFFAFSKVETNAFLILLPLMLLLIFSEPAYRYWFVNKNQHFERDSIRLDSLIASRKLKHTDSILSVVQPSYFLFNPNTASREMLIQLGFSNSFASRIINYRAKGGVYKKKSDLLKIFGADTMLVKKLSPFIDLPNDVAQKKSTYLKDSIEKKKVYAMERFDVNLVDTAQLKKVYGIGEKLSIRIVAYRERLGGFVHMDQLREIYRLDTGVIARMNKKFFVAPRFAPRQIQINTISEKELAAHPYFSYKVARTIIAYRFQHGNFATAEDLLNLKLITEKDWQKIKQYISINP